MNINVKYIINVLLSPTLWSSLMCIVMVILLYVVMLNDNAIDCDSCCRYIETFMYSLDNSDIIFSGRCYGNCHCVF